MSRLMLAILLLLLVSSLNAFAIGEFETVITETQFNSSSRVVISKEEIEKSHARNLTSLLASQANISVTQSNFTPSSIFLRGGDSSHILILIDGVPFYDASTIQRTINLNSIDVKSVQRIEVIKGSQSVLYGGQALSGVIKIETIPRELKNSGYVLGQTGSFHQVAGSAGGLAAIDEQSAVVLHGSYAQKDSVSPVLVSKQVYPTRLGTAELSYINRQSSVHYLFKAQTAFDKSLIATTDATGYYAADADRFETSTYQLSGTGIISIPQSRFAPLLSVSTQKGVRLFEQDAFAAQGPATKRDYIGDLMTARYDMIAVDLGRFIVLNLGGSFSREKFEYRSLDILNSDVASEFEGFFMKGKSRVINNLEVEFGFRSDFHQMKDKIDTYQVGLTAFQDIKIEYSTGFKQPSLFQLTSDYGNSKLQPEKSKSTSVTLDHKFSEQFFISYTYFINEFENLIIIRGNPARYENVDSSDSRGHELTLGFDDTSNSVTYNLTFGYQEPYDNSQKTWLVRRPMRTASLKIRKDFDSIGLGAEMIHTGSRRDKTGTDSYGTLSSYTLLNLIADYKIDQKLSLFSRGQNIANQRYESSYGFYDEGLSVQVGAEYEF